MIKNTVTISLDTYKHMENKIKNLEQAIDDLKLNKEMVSYSRGCLQSSYWFFNPSDAVKNISEALNNLREENEKLRSELKLMNRNIFYRLFS